MSDDLVKFVLLGLKVSFKFCLLEVVERIWKEKLVEVLFLKYRDGNERYIGGNFEV